MYLPTPRRHLSALSLSRSPVTPPSGGTDDSMELVQVRMQNKCCNKYVHTHTHTHVYTRPHVQLLGTCFNHRTILCEDNCDIYIYIYIYIYILNNEKLAELKFGESANKSVCRRTFSKFIQNCKY